MRRSVLQALLPVMMLNGSVRDGVMLVLRKALFARDADSRCIAISGLLMLLRQAQVRPP